MSSQLNIVFIFSDQQRWNSVGCYGQPLPTTLHMDRMASALTVPDRALRSAFLALLLPLLIALPVFAHNGAVAIAVPVEGITVDGDLSDWPEDMVKYPIRRVEAGVPVQDEADLHGVFRIGYSEEENALYIAVEAHDQSMVMDTSSAANWNTQDGCEVYIDAVHGREVDDLECVQCL